MSNDSKPGLTAAGKKNRRDLYLIIGILAAVVIASTTLYRAASSGAINLPNLLGTSNNGALISPPLALADLQLQSLSGEPFDYAAQQPQWTMLLLAGAECDEACKQNLYLSRQVRSAMGKEAPRIRRYLVTTGPLSAETEAYLVKEHPTLLQLRADRTAVERFLAPGLGGKDAFNDHLYFVVDPNGWVMMFYTPAHDGKAVMADLKFLLKYSHEQDEG